MLLFFFTILQRFIKEGEQVECINAPADYDTTKVIYLCNEEKTGSSRIGKSGSVVYVTSCTFINMKATAEGAAIYLTNPTLNSVIYNSLFVNCNSGSKNGGAIRVSTTSSESFLNITKCTFTNNYGKSGGAIYFKSIYGTISQCKFYNNTASGGNGGDFYYVSSDKATANTAEILLVENCEFTRTASDATQNMFYISWSPVSDLHFLNNIVNIDLTTGVILFGLSTGDKGPNSNLICENNLITNTDYIIPSSMTDTQLGLAITPGFKKIPDSGNPDVPVPSNPNCPSPPDSSYIDIDDHTNQVNKYVYGCEKTRLTQLEVGRCVVYLYSCTFLSIDSQTENGGAIKLSTGLSSNTQQPTPEGDCAIHNCTFRNCRGASGGAIYLQMQGSTRFAGIINCTFTNNTATNNLLLVGGGALYIYATFVTVSNCTFIDNQANQKGQEIYFKINEYDEDWENPLLITNCTIYQNVASTNSSLIFLEWNKNADLFFNYNTIKLADNLIAYLFENDGEDINLGNLSCKSNALLPSRDLLCKKGTALYNRIKKYFQISDTPKEDIVFDDAEKCKESETKRCQTVNQQETYEHVTIEVSSFTNFKNDDNGGAVYLVNTGVTCIGTTYSECSSNNKGGGAIFFYNKVDVDNEAEFIGVTIESCSAVFGGGAYVYSKSERNEVLFHGCTFKGNKAHTSASEGNNGLFGGGAIYLTASVGALTECTFLKNSGGSVKINDNFEQHPNMEGQTSSMILDDQQQETFLTILNCKFESKKNTKSASLFFVNSKGSKQVMNCIFTGKIAKGTYHIDAVRSEMVHVDSCSFSSKMNQAFNANVIRAASNNMEIKERSMKLWLSVAAFGIACCAVIAAFIVKRDDNEKENSDNHEASLTSLDSENTL